MRGYFSVLVFDLIVSDLMLSALDLAVSPPPANGEKHLLIIGMRSRENMMFENEILLMVKAGVIDVEIMFSRDECKPTFSENEIVYEDFPGRSGYIDKVILDNQERMTRIIREHGAYMYVLATHT